MDWQKRSKIKRAELSQDMDKIIEAYQPATIEKKRDKIRIPGPLGGFLHEYVSGFIVEYEDKIIEYKVDLDNICMRI